MIIQGLPTQFNKCDGTRWIFILLSAYWISLDALIVTIHAGWYVGRTQETER